MIEPCHCGKSVYVLCMVYVSGDVKTSGVVECRMGSGWILYKDEHFGDIEFDAHFRIVVTCRNGM